MLKIRDLGINVIPSRPPGIGRGGFHAMPEPCGNSCGEVTIPDCTKQECGDTCGTTSVCGARSAGNPPACRGDSAQPCRGDSAGPRPPRASAITPDMAAVLRQQLQQHIGL